MKTLSSLIGILVLCRVLFPQTLIIEEDSAVKQYDVNRIRNTRFTTGDSLSSPSLSLHSTTGIRQFKLSTIDSIGFTDSATVKIIQKDSVYIFRNADIDYFNFCPISLPDRNTGALQGSAFIGQILNDALFYREPKIKEQIFSGNIPDFMRNLITIKSDFKDLNRVTHTVEYDVFPDYLSIGSTEDFCRMPMTPQTAQAIADSFGCILPTRKLVDDIWQHATIRLTPITYAPVGDENTKVYKFRDHNTDIEAARIQVGGQPGELIAGIKKDVVICNTLKTKPGYVAIYGWHYTSGVPIQPLYTGHIDQYVDYSHGIRLINEVMRVDGVPMRAQDILRDPILYKLISDEDDPMTQAYYKY